MRIVLTDVEYTAKGKFKLPIAVVARQIGPIWNDYCGNGEAESERCNFLRNLMKPLIAEPIPKTICPKLIQFGGVKSPLCTS